jgi:hypothetical protein
VPVTYQIEQDKNLIRTKCSGNVEMPEVLDHFRTLENDPQRPAAAHVFLDLREATSLPSADQLRAVTTEIARVAMTLRFGACAIITDRDGMFGMARMFSVFAENYFRAISVFRSAVEGERWLEEHRAAGERSSAGISS